MYHNQEYDTKSVSMEVGTAGKMKQGSIKLTACQLAWQLVLYLV